MITLKFWLVSLSRGCLTSDYSTSHRYTSPLAYLTLWLSLRTCWLAFQTSCLYFPSLMADFFKLCPMLSGALIEVTDTYSVQITPSVSPLIVFNLCQIWHLMSEVGRVEREIPVSRCCAGALRKMNLFLGKNHYSLGERNDRQSVSCIRLHATFI